MYSVYQDEEELEDDLYQEDEGDCEGSEVDSELEFHLYSQLHYSSNPGEMEELEDGEEKEDERKRQDGQQHEALEKTTDGDSELENNSKPPSPSSNNLQQCPKKKTEKQKKRKSDPKSQKLSSSQFEVIVIDSSPEVISLSEGDTTDDDKGVCASKGQLQTSTPVQQEAKKRKRSLDVPVTLVSSSSELDTEESESSFESDSTDSSDSDGLESWMILGGGRQDEDQSISLNLKGGSDSNTDADADAEGSWLVTERDKEAQIYNKDRGYRITVQRLSNRYYTGKNVQCRNCSKTGHLSKNCPDPKKLLSCLLCGTTGHLSNACPNKYCNNCGQPGHLYESCSERAYWHKQCHRCSMTGHFFDACPEVWRQYHITTKTKIPVKKQGTDDGRYPAYCYNCSQKGHFGHECTRQRMFKGVYPSIPFISYYDTVEDINCRQHRIKLKAKAMRKNGYLAGPSQTPLTPGPPNKKQRVSHHKSNDQPNNTPQQTPNNHKATPSHIFFNDKFRDSTPKTKKLKQQEGVGSVKPWKPKRPVPTSREPLPPAKLVLDEADDFPRGGRPEENSENKKKKKKRNKMKHVPSSLSDGQRDRRPENLCWTGTGSGSGRRQGSASKHQRVEKKRNRRNRAEKNLGAQMYPADENLFIIKQRKRRR